MAEDALIAGAAAPARRRLIRAPAVLDAVWVVAAAFCLASSSWFALIDLPAATLRTGDAPLRVFVLGVPVLAMLLAVAGAARSSTSVVAVATGVLVPGAALAGSLALLLFLDRASAFANTGVTVSIGAALVVLITVVRWFVYHPIPLLSDEVRPPVPLSRTLAALGVIFICSVLVLGSDTAMIEAAWIGQTAALLLVPVVVIGAALARSVPAAWLAAGAAGSQVVAVVVAKVEQSSITFDSDLLLRTGVPGLVLLVAMVVVVVTCVRSAVVDDTSSEPAHDDAAWRWSIDD